jgi:hypothetical protein
MKRIIILFVLITAVFLGCNAIHHKRPNKPAMEEKRQDIKPELNDWWNDWRNEEEDEWEDEIRPAEGPGRGTYTQT